MLNNNNNNNNDVNISDDHTSLAKRACQAILTCAKKYLDEDTVSGGGCRAFYTPDEWKQRGEEYGLNSVLIVCHDGGDLTSFFSYDHEQYEFIEIMNVELAKIGLCAEQCTTWYSAIYKIEGDSPKCNSALN